MTSSSSAGAKVQVEYSICPPGWSMSAAFLDLGKLLGFFRGPVSGKGFFFAEHAFARTGSIQNDLMEKFREVFYHFFWFFVGNKEVGNSEKLQVAKKGSGSGRTDVVGNQKAGAF